MKRRQYRQRASAEKQRRLQHREEERRPIGGNKCTPGKQGQNNCRKVRRACGGEPTIGGQDQTLKNTARKPQAPARPKKASTVPATRYEILLPLKYNDGREVEPAKFLLTCIKRLIAGRANH